MRARFAWSDPFFETVIAATNDAIVVTKGAPASRPDELEIVFVNQAFSRLSGYAPDEILGRNPRILQGPGTDRGTLDRIAQAVRERLPVQAELLNYARDGREYWVELNILPLRGKSGRVTHFAAIQRDITAQKQVARQIAELASTDALTGLPNRNAFLKDLRREVLRVQRYGRQLAYLSLDIDRFKAVNDSFGTDVGDAALRHVADLCTGALRQNDVCGRLGGEEFGIFVPETNLYGAELVARRLRTRIEAARLDLGRRSVGLSVSIGVAALMQQGQNGTEQMMQDADAAMRRAKNAGRNRVEVAPPRLAGGNPLALSPAVSTALN